MSLLKHVSHFIDGVSEHTGRLTAWLTFALTLVTAWDVAMRYLFRSGSVAMQELEWHIFSIIFLLSAAYTLKHDAHVRVDVFYARLSDRGKAVVDLVGSLGLLIPFCVMLILVAKGFVESSWIVREGSGDPGGLPARYILKAMIPIGFALLLLQGVSLTIKSFIKVFGVDNAGKGPCNRPPGVNEGVNKDV